MAARAFIRDVRFNSNTDNPATFRVLAGADYLNDAALLNSESFDETVDFASTDTQIQAVLVAAAVNQAPVGFEVVASEVLLPGLVSG